VPDHRGPHVQHPRPRGVPAPLGDRRDRAGADRGVRGGQLSAGAAGGGVGGAGWMIFSRIFESVSDSKMRQIF
jgi:hypothetical protein